MQKNILRKVLTIEIIVLFIGTNFILNITGDSNHKNQENPVLKNNSVNILLYNTYVDYGYDNSFCDQTLPAILQNHGYSITLKQRSTTPYVTSSLLNNYDELWLISAQWESQGCFSQQEIDTILNYRLQGHGILIMTDHGDYVTDANQIANLFGVNFYGEVAHYGSVTFDNHPLFSGVNSIYLYSTEPHMFVISPTDVVATCLGDNLIAVFDDGNGRIVFDRTWLQLDDVYINTGNTPQYLCNIADWLMGSGNPHLTANFQWEPLNPYEDDSTTFTSTSIDPDNDIIEWTWFIQDYTSYILKIPIVNRLSGQKINYVFKHQGLYYVCLVVRDVQGRSSSIVKSINVIYHKKCALIIQSFIGNGEGEFGAAFPIKDMLLAHGWKTDNIIDFAANRMDVDDVKARFHYLANIADIGDKIFVFIRTHGHAILGHAWMDFDEWWKPEGLSYGELNDELKHLPSGTKESIIISSCRSGEGMTALKEDSRVVCTSTDWTGEDSYTWGWDYTLLNGYNNGINLYGGMNYGSSDINHNGIISAEEAYLFSKQERFLPYYGIDPDGTKHYYHPQIADCYPSSSNNELELDLVSTSEVNQYGQGIVSGGETKQTNKSNITINVQLDSSLNEAIFSLCWSNGSFNFILQKPDGSMIDPEIAMGDPNITFINTLFFTAYRILTPVSGEWQLMFNAPSQDESITYQVSGSTNITINMSLDKNEFYKNENVKIDVNLSCDNEPVDGAIIFSKIFKPDNSLEQIILYDDGLHEDGAANDGWYANIYDNADINGSYQFKAIAIGSTRNESFSRESSDQFAYLVYLPPYANASGPFIADVNQAVQFNGSNSYDKDGDIALYSWDFGDGENGTGMAPQHIYQSKSIYNVTLTVTDNDGLTNYMRTQAYIGIPYVKFIYPKSGNSISNIAHLQWFAVNSTGSNNLNISIYYSSDFGQIWNPIVEQIENTGVLDFNTSTMQEGIYELKIEATDKVDQKGIGYSGIIGISQAPSQPTKPSGSTIILPEIEYTFSTSATDPEGNPLYYFWDWGDGTGSDWLGPVESGDIIIANHTWFTSSRQNRIDIRVIARDAVNVLSNWSESLKVDIINVSLLKNTFLLGLINHKTVENNFTCFNANFLLSVGLSPFNIRFYKSNEKYVVSNYYRGQISSKLIIGVFNGMLISESYSSTINFFGNRFRHLLRL